MSAKVSIEETGEVSRDIKILIPRGQYDEKFSSGVNKAAQQARIKGFRPGKAPRQVVEKMYGDRIQNDVLEELVSQAYREALDDHKLNVVGYPKIDIKPIEEGKDVEISAAVELYPAPEIKDYKKLNFECEVTEYSDQLMDSELTRVAEMFASSEPVSRKKVKKGDLLKVSYSGTIGGEPFDGSEAKEVTILLGASSVPENFEKAMVGLEKEKEQSIEVDMAGDIANPAIAGKKASYSITVHEISERKIPELTDEFVKEKEVAEDLAALKKQIKDTIDRDIERRNHQSKVEGYFSTLLDKLKFEVPGILVDEEIRNILFEARLLDPNDQKSYQISVEGFRESLGERAEMRVKQGVALERILEQEGIEIGDKDVDEWLEKEAKQSSVGVDEIKKIYDLPKSLDRLKSHLAREKVMESLLAECKIKASKPEEENKKKGGKKKAAAEDKE